MNPFPPGAFRLSEADAPHRRGQRDDLRARAGRADQHTGQDFCSFRASKQAKVVAGRGSLNRP